MGMRFSRTEAEHDLACIDHVQDMDYWQVPSTTVNTVQEWRRVEELLNSCLLHDMQQEANYGFHLNDYLSDGSNDAENVDGSQTGHTEYCCNRPLM